jgi:hypothetical protein
MGRIVDLCGEIAAEAEEGSEGLVLPPEAHERLRGEWSDDDIEDALSLVQDSLLQSELVESSDSLSARLVEVLGGYAEDKAFAHAQAGDGPMSLEIIGQLARRLQRLEEVLEIFREGKPPDRRGFDALRQRLADLGIEAEMEAGRAAEAQQADEDDDE